MTIRHSRIPRMGNEEFEEFNELCIQYRHIFEYWKSPEPDELADFDHLLRQTPYVAAMLHTGEFQVAIGVLEKRFQQGLAKAVIIRKDPADHPSDELKRARTLEREVRFIHRCAALSRRVLDDEYVFFSAPQEESRKRAIKSLRTALKELERLAPDPYLQDAYVKDDGATDIARFTTDQLPKAIEHLSTANPEYAMTRRTNEEWVTEVRQLVDRLVDSCQRLYAYCDFKIVNRLLSCSWLGLGIGHEVTPKDVERSLGRKMRATDIRTNGQLAIPEEDLLDADIRKGWRKLSPHPDNWMPGYVLEASWLQA